MGNCGWCAQWSGETKILKTWKIIVTFYFKSPPQKIGLTEKEFSFLFKQSSFLFRHASMSIRSITYGLMLSLLYLFASNFTILEFATAGIVWILLYGYYSLNLTSMIYFINAYIYVLSLIIRIKLNRFSELTSRINWMKVHCSTRALSENSSNESSKPSNATILVNTFSKTRLNFRNQWFYLMNEIVKDISTYNTFWRHILTITILW